MIKDLTNTPKEAKLNKLLNKASKQEDKYEALSYELLTIAILMTKDFIKLGGKRIDSERSAHIRQLDLATQNLFKKQHSLFSRLCNGFPYDKLEDGTILYAMEPHSYATIIAELSSHDERMEAIERGEDLSKFKPSTYERMRKGGYPVDE